MGTVHRFERRRKRPFPAGGKDWPIAGILIAIIIGSGVGLFALTYWSPSKANAPSNQFICSNPQIVDGDTLRCGEKRIRLSGIDAPELPGHCRTGRQCTLGDPYASTANLREIVDGGPLMCQQTDIDRYGRIVALCAVGGVDLSCRQVRDGHAVRRYAPLRCD